MSSSTNQRFLDAVASNTPLLLYDGVCNVCNASVQQIIAHDKHQRFQFCALQSEVAQNYLLSRGITSVPDSVILIYGGRVFIESDAVLQCCRLLGGVASLAYAGIIVPRVLRNVLYRFIARHRYKWFGRRDACMIPTPELRRRFLDEF